MKHTLTILTAVAGLWAFLATPGAAHAQAADFTLNATVDLKSLHEDVTGFTIGCFACSAVPCPGGGAGDAKIGFAIQSFDTNGAFNVNQQVQVGVNADEGKDPRDAVAYYCQIRLRVVGDSNTHRPFTFSQANNEFNRAQQNTQVVNEFTGAFNQ